MDNRDVERGEIGGGANPGALQDQWGSIDTAAEDDFIRANSHVLATNDRDYPNGATVFDQNAIDQGIAVDLEVVATAKWIEIGEGAVPAGVIDDVEGEETDRGVDIE